MKEDIIKKTPPEADILERSVLFLISLFKRNLKKIIIAGFIGGVLGGAITYLLPKKFTAKAELLPEYKESRFSGFSSLANLAGIDLANSSESDAIRPDLYPNILQSTPAIIHLLKQPVKTVENKQFPNLLSYLESINKEKEKSQIGAILAKTVDTSVLNFSKDEIRLIQNLKSSLTTNFDKKTGIIYIGVEMRDPVIAAATLSEAIQYLSDYVSGYRSKKKHDESEFIKSRVQEANNQLKNAEYALQRYRDNNRNVFNNVAKIEEQKLQSNYIHSQNLRNDLLNQLEKATLAEKEGRPIIQILEPPIVPVKKSSPTRIIYAIVGAFVFSILTLVTLSIRNK
ncbi:Chain length determinant protein [Dyadobacter koreensis]|uniref:Chain length determinant protein n=1 Tax=Dyadobacter koreensis TaxID=408657 RepID=A0A1H6R8N7_9BACT|nr:Wzz/FepE/Etk N-terminal domain-containing protein [Dyadobacter koreensis]SEI52113.1 Chain length determinant protein [Dyadobacter koreensis]